MCPSRSPNPDLKPIQVDPKIQTPIIKSAKPDFILAPQPKTALAPAAMPWQEDQPQSFDAPVHLGQTFGVLPNPNAKGPATVAAIGNEYGGRAGGAIAPHGIPVSSGIWGCF